MKVLGKMPKNSDESEDRIHRIWPSVQDKLDIIKTLASCCYIISEELAKRVSLQNVPIEVSYHVGLAAQLLGVMAGHINEEYLNDMDIDTIDITNIKCYHKKLEMIIESLILIRDSTS